jgi:hypothetical protein
MTKDNILHICLAVFELVFAGGLLLHLNRKKSPDQLSKDIKQVKEEKKNEIEKTPAADLVSAAPNADELHSDANGIKERAKQRIWDRAGKIISGLGNSGNSDSS